MVAKDTQAFSFRPVLGITKAYCEFSAVRRSAEKHLWETVHFACWLALVKVLLHFAPHRFFVNWQHSNFSQGWRFAVLRFRCRTGSRGACATTHSVVPTSSSAETSSWMWNLWWEISSLFCPFTSAFTIQPKFKAVTRLHNWQSRLSPSPVPLTLALTFTIEHH